MADTGERRPNLSLGFGETNRSYAEGGRRGPGGDVVVGRAEASSHQQQVAFREPAAKGCGNPLDVVPDDLDVSDPVAELPDPGGDPRGVGIARRPC
jgi:hypothetical protein